MTFANPPAARKFSRRSPSDRRSRFRLPEPETPPPFVVHIPPPSLSVQSGRLVAALAFGMALVHAANLVAQYGLLYHNEGAMREVIRLFNVSAEANVPSWFNASLLLIDGLLLGLILLARRDAVTSFAGHWGVLAAGFAYLSLDEAAAVHENLNGPMVQLTRWLGFAPGGLLTFAWPIAAIAGLGIVAWWFGPFLRHLPRGVRRSFLVAGGIYLSGAVVMEVVGGYMFDTHGYYSKGFAIASSIEELLEMTGLILFADALMRYLRTHIGEVTLDVR